MKLACTVDGPEGAPVMVLSTSLGTTRDVWLPLLAELSHGYRLLRFDHPGHGASPVPDVPVSVAGIGRAVLGLLDMHGLDRVSFCGLSLGGMVGLWLAAHAPERIDRLVLCCTSARVAPEPYLQRASVVVEQGTGAVADSVLSRWFTLDFAAREPEVVAGFREMIAGISDGGYVACCHAVAGFDGRADLPAITAPTLVIAGEEDAAIPVAHSEFLRDGISGSELIVIPAAAHMAIVEQPQLVITAIERHLGRIA